MLYTRLVDRYPEVFEMRKYRGYCLIQLGRWQEAKAEFERLAQNGWLDVYSVVPQGTPQPVLRIGFVYTRKSKGTEAACV